MCIRDRYISDVLCGHLTADAVFIFYIEIAAKEQEEVRFLLLVSQ